jgi:hypothetical protein
LAISRGADDPLYNIDGFACGISMSYQVAHMLLYFLPVRSLPTFPNRHVLTAWTKLFLASLLSAIVYSLIFLILRGTLAINGGLRIQFDPERRLRPHNGTYEEYQRFIYSVARTMLW